jgi:hypothetical protein
MRRDGRMIRAGVWGLVASAATLPALAGCQSGAPRRVASREPALNAPVDQGATVVEAPPRPAQTISFVDRHPLFSKPRQMYESSSGSKVVKTAAATMIGIPAGFVGEIKQIVTGTPAEPR